MVDRETIERVAAMLAEAKSTVVFTGAGISTASGISDFRSPGGVWSRYQPVYFEEFLSSHAAREAHWRMKREAWPEFAAARPNLAHEILARWEDRGRIAGIITQNIDGLHQEAGSRNVYELHGTGKYVYCLSCDRHWPSQVIFDRFADSEEVPVCDQCGGWLKPATVSFGQPLPMEVLDAAHRLAVESDLFLSIGSSLVVEPAASLPRSAQQSGADLIIINREPTPLDGMARAVIREPIVAALQALDQEINV